jgi:Haem-degrading
MDLLALAKTIADRVEAEASRAKIPVAVCVIDVHGNIVLHHRMSGAPAFANSPSGKLIRRRWWGCEQPTSFRLCSLGKRSSR